MNQAEDQSEIDILHEFCKWKKLLKLAQYFYNSNSVKALNSADYRMAPERAPDSRVKSI